MADSRSRDHHGNRDRSSRESAPTDSRFSTCGSLQYDLIPKALSTKYFVQRQTDEGVYPRVAMEVNASVGGKQVPHQNQPLKNHTDERVGAPAQVSR